MTPVNAPVGFIISWRVPTTVALDDLHASLVKAGLSLDLAPALKPAQLVARTAGYLAKFTSEKNVRKLARPVSYTARQITREEVDADQLTYSREAGLSIDEHTQEVVCDDPTLAAQLPQTTTTVRETRTASDLTRIVQKVIEDAGSDLIPVRHQGGAYFIPSGHGVVWQVSVLLEGVGGELSKFACTLGHGSDESIANTITDYLLKQIAELQESVEELNETGIRADVKSRRLTRVADLRDRIHAYASLIQAHGSKLDAALDKAEASLLAKLGADREPQLAEVS
jgi:hypothetical protein